jgi:hypothetical protein
VRPDYAEIFMPPAADVSVARRFAYAIIAPVSDSPGFLLRRALEERGGNPCLGSPQATTAPCLFCSPRRRSVSRLWLFLLSLSMASPSLLSTPKRGQITLLGVFLSLLSSLPLVFRSNTGMRGDPYSIPLNWEHVLY